MEALVEWLKAFWDQCSTLADCGTAFTRLSTEHQTITNIFTSLVSGGVLIKFVSDRVKRPIIDVRLDRTLGCHGPVPLALTIGPGGAAIARQERGGRYLRLHIQNTGRTLMQKCGGHLVKITSAAQGRKATFDSEVVACGWANIDQLKIDIPPGAHFYMDVPAATLVLSQDGNSSVLYMQNIPSTLSVI